MNMTKFEGNHYSHTKIQGNSLIGEIIETAVAGLRAMFDPGKNLFCFKRVKGENGLFNEGISLRYTIISLLGLESLEKNNLRHTNPYKSMLERLKIHLNEIDNIGDLGLLIWLYAISSPGQLFEIIDFINNTNPLERYADAIQGKTTELAWFLTGLSYAALVHGEKGDYLNELGDKTYGLIKRNYYGEGIFGHVRKSTLSGIFRARIGSLADQV